MRRKLCIAMTLCMLVGQAFTAISSSSASDVSSEIPTLPVTISISHPDGVEPLTTWVEPVSFPHALHVEKAACLDCHHTEEAVADGGVLTEYAPCSDCHVESDRLDPMSFYAAWHAKSSMSCVGCHYEQHLAGQDKAPISCTKSCHKNGTVEE